MVAALLSCAGVAGCAGAERVSPPSAERVGGGARIVLGPMVGHVTDRTARLWVETDRGGELSVVLTGPDGSARRSVIRIGGAEGGVGLVDVGALEPATEYEARFALDGVALAVEPPIAFRTFPPAGAPSRSGSPSSPVLACRGTPSSPPGVPWPRTSPTRSCGSATTGISSTRTRYGLRTTRAPERIEFRYREIKALATVQPVLRGMANYAIWDDRDYGNSDSDRTHPLRLEAAALFERYWANPAYGEEPGRDGIYSAFRIGAAEVFLLDDRFWRDPDTLPDSPAKTVLGSAQKRWLKEALAASDAALKLIAIGHQVLPDYHDWESYAMFAHERRELLDWIREQRVEGVMFVTGDRHLSELMRADPEGLYPLYELTASPIANRPFTTGLELPNPIRIAGYGAGDSYGIVDLDTTVTPARLTIRVKDAAGNEVLRHEISMEELRFRESAP